MQILDPLFRYQPLAAIFEDRTRIQKMLDFEAALALAEAKAGVIPATAASTIGNKCKSELFDLKALAESAALSGNIAIPLVRQLTALVATENREAAKFVHWGATSQDVIDTGLVLQLRDAFVLIQQDLLAFASALAEQIQKYRTTPIAGRTWLQQAVPTTLGFQMAGWLDAISRHRARLGEAAREVSVLQFGGAVGTLAALGDRGMEVSKLLAESLRVELPNLPWHTHRDRLAAAMSVLGILTGTIGKIARDLSLMIQTETGEAAEPAVTGRGGSSTMPHKRNPVACSVALSAAVRVPPLVSTILSAMVQEQERGLGGWQAEWEVIPEIVCLSAGALHHLSLTVQDLEINVDRMRQNLELTQGLIFAEAVAMVLSETTGRGEAHRMIEAASEKTRSSNKHLKSVLLEDTTIAKHLSAAELDRLFDPAQYRGSANAFIDRVLRAHADANEKAR